MESLLISLYEREKITSPFLKGDTGGFSNLPTLKLLPALQGAGQGNVVGIFQLGAEG
jgi:hypothetical protein